MIARVFTSATAGLAVTAGLLFVMQFLVAVGEEIIVEPRPRFDLRLTRVKIKEDVEEKRTTPERPDKPKMPPKKDLARPRDNGGIGVHVPLQTPRQPGRGSAITGINFGDGPLVNIYKVYPTYPINAASRGLEGTVLVQYDVTTAGEVVNVIVLESTDSIFNKAAIAAAYRFKYKPRTVDGIPYETRGLRNLFRFEMEN